MNNTNLAASTAAEQKSEIETNFYLSGKREGVAGKTRPSHLEIPEWYAGWTEGYQQYCLKTQHLVEYGGTVSCQGYLLASYEDIKAKYGEICQIDDYDGWQINEGFLDIELITFNHEDPKSETAWHIHCDNWDAVKVIGGIFGMERVSIKRPVDEFGDYEVAA